MIKNFGYLAAITWMLWSLACSAPPLLCSADKPCAGGAVCVEGACACAAGSTLCGETCVSLTTSNAHCGDCDQPCAEQKRCIQGLCQCPDNQSDCHGKCVDTRQDAAHCGRCGVRCQGAERCVQGRCLTTCPTDTPTPCGNRCVDLQSDTLHCGACDKACPGGQQCNQGTCQCPAGLRRCGDACVDVREDNAHCGECSKACSSGQSCGDGRCNTTCPKSSPTNCLGGCVDTTRNDNHCGRCGNTCLRDQRCQDSQCQCPPGQQICDGKCVDIRTDGNHCGVCDRKCATGKVCGAREVGGSGGLCLDNCPIQTESACFGGCFDTQKDVRHCGKCGNACPGQQICVTGKCQCPPDTLLCDGKCVDTNTDPIHCGGCAKICPTSQLCAAGKCVENCPTQTPDACDGGCFDQKQSATHCGACGNPCVGGQRCNNGQCQCTGTLTACGGLCVDTTKDRLNCGGCGLFCQAGERCEAGSNGKGQCVLGCGTLIACGGICIDTNTDDRHCGKCDNPCAGDKRCTDGSCKCPAQRTDCSGECVDLQNETRHCGTCGNTCQNGKVCVAGTCQLVCQNASLTPCNGACVDTKSDSSHCGTCGTACISGQSCESGVCKCPPAQVACTPTGGTSSCIDTTIDPNHCGSCNNKCQTGEFCQGGQCKLCSAAAPTQCGTTCCTPSQICCGNQCVDTKTDTDHCGTCGNKCSPGQLCLVPSGSTNGQCACANGQNRACYSGPANTQQKGTCKDGTQTCIANQWGPCTGDTKPTTEICDGLDNNCDGQIDETFTTKGNACSAGIGLCQRSGTLVCNTAGNNVRCNAVAAPPQSELCDNKDNNCDGTIDENLTRTCFTGNATNRNKGECKDGSQTCNAGTWSTCAGQTLPTAETCNNKDDDCDGSVDETLSRSCFTGNATNRNKGECKDGTQTCNAGTWGTCTGQTLPAAETCNNKDDDCDGSIDEAVTRACFTGNATNRNKGECKDGTQTCNAGTWGSCTGQTLPVAETCNNKDDDCDGSIDETLTRACYTGPVATRNQGECKDGSQICSQGIWGACTGQTLPATETCNNKDDDCDGQVDEGVTGSLCPKQLGVCQNSRQQCVNGTFVTCTNANYGTNYEITESKCDGLDNDCNGQTDENLARKGPLCAKQAGWCAGARSSCVGGAWAACGTNEYGVTYQAVETSCDRHDNDCDGQIDEGCTVCHPTVAFQTITMPGTGVQLAYSPHGNVIASGYRSYRVGMWNATTGAAITNFSSGGGPFGVQYAPFDDFLLVCGSRPTIHNATTGAYIRQLNAHPSYSPDAAFNLKGTQMVASGILKDMVLWDMSTYTTITTWTAPTAAVHLGWSRSGIFIAGGLQSGDIVIWKPDGSVSRTLTGHTNQISGLAISPNDLYIASASYDKTIRVWNTTTWQQVWSQTLTNAPIGASFRWDSKALIYGTGTTIEGRDATNGNLLFSIPGHTGTISDVAWSPTGKQIASTAADSTLRLWQCP